MRTLLISIFLVLQASPGLAKTPTADELLDAMDTVLQFQTRTSTTTMQVIDSRTTRTYKMVTFGRGQDEAAIEYLEPVREKGTKMLKKGDNLWLYMPRAERVQKISGHMLRQGMMGSDISYEDMMDAADFRKKYGATLEGEAEVDGQPCWKLVAKAHDDTVSYPKRVIWIDEKTYVPRRQELYALSGMLLKVWTMSKVEIIDGRPVATHMEISDQLRQGSKTTLDVSEVKFGIALESEVFSLRWLERT